MRKFAAVRCLRQRLDRATWISRHKPAIEPGDLYRRMLWSGRNTECNESSEASSARRRFGGAVANPGAGGLRRSVIAVALFSTGPAIERQPAWVPGRDQPHLAPPKVAGQREPGFEAADICLPDARSHVYLACPDQADLRRAEASRGLPGAGGPGSRRIKSPRFRIVAGPRHCLLPAPVAAHSRCSDFARLPQVGLATGCWI
jgi:hypothetical protein